MSTHKELAQKLAKLERRIERHDTEIQGIFELHRLYAHRTSDLQKASDWYDM